MVPRVVILPLARTTAWLSSLMMSIAVAAAAASATEALQNSREIEGDVDVVWADVVEVFASRGIELKTPDRDAGNVESEPVIVSDPSFADCSQLTWGEKVLKFSAVYGILVRSAGPGTQLVTVEIEYVQERWSMTRDDVHDMPCKSTGVIEAGLLDALEQRARSR